MEKKKDTRPEWAKRTLTPTCPACGGYLLPCTKTATGVHPDVWEKGN